MTDGLRSGSGESYGPMLSPRDTHLEKARCTLEEARRALAVDAFRAAASQAYVVTLHGAQALLLDRTGCPGRKHKHVISLFGQQSCADPQLGKQLGRFINRSYWLMTVADYDTSKEVDAVTAKQAVEGARLFLERVQAALRPST